MEHVMENPKSTNQRSWVEIKSGERIFFNGDQMLGRFANFFQVGHNAVEFLFDFGQFYRNDGQAQFHTRIITSPVYARALLEILQDSLNKYEAVFGNIPEEEQ
jgi:hypothetical protein